MPDTYPTPGSLGDQIYRSTEEEMEERFVRLPDDTSTSPPPEHLEELQTKRLYGLTTWRDPDRELLINVQYPPLEETPASVMLQFTVADDSFDYLPRLNELGFPVPESSPSFIAGRRGGPMGKTTSWRPGPPGLVDLSYRVRGEGFPALLIVYSTSPPEPEYSEEREQDEEAFPWDGTVVFESLEDIEAGAEPDEYLKPGSVRARMIL